MDLGENIAQTAIREVHEETGLTIEIDGIVGIYSDPRHLIEYSDGEVRQQFNICFRGRLIAGTLRGSDESTDGRWVSPVHLDELPHASHHSPAPAALPLKPRALRRLNRPASIHQSDRSRERRAVSYSCCLHSTSGETAQAVAAPTH